MFILQEEMVEIPQITNPNVEKLTDAARPLCSEDAARPELPSRAPAPPGPGPGGGASPARRGASAAADLEYPAPERSALRCAGRYGRYFADPECPAPERSALCLCG